MLRSKLILSLSALLLAPALVLAAPAAKKEPTSPPPAAPSPFLSPPAGTSAGLDPDLLAGLTARSIGPATMSGRVAAIDALVADPRVIYVGASTGGVWKTTNGGTTWQPVFDHESVAAIGAVAIYQPNPDIVWVGTGEGNPRNSASVGNGVYKSVDGGRTWQHLGLNASERIARILLDPRDPKVAYVAAMGPTWASGCTRGVFKTVDGGATWQQVLSVDQHTGAADLAMDPTNPDKLIAAMWDHMRTPWSFRSGGPGSGLYLTADGGTTWRHLTPEDGMPKGELGRMGLAFAPSDPRVVYALVEAKKNALLRSDDGGYSWRSVNDETNVASRPFYYADIRVAPDNPNTVYNLASILRVSEDGGRTFRVLAGFSAIHPDHHALWIHPQDGNFMLEGNDGGVVLTEDRGTTWRFIGNLPVAQYYHVRLDNQVPYNVYGGLQDNGSWVGPSQVWENGGIRNYHWQELNFGDGFDTVPDPTNPDEGYAMAQEGYLVRWNRRTGQQKSIRPAPPEGETLRFNWNAAIAIDPHDPTGRTLYFGSQYVHKSTDRGDTWTLISPDLTSDNPEWQKQAESGGLTPDVTGAENFTTIISIAPSPLTPGLIWVGTDDGRIQVTRDGGGHWTSVEGNLPKSPPSKHPQPNTWVPQVTPSPHHEGTAFVVLDGHRGMGWTPYVYRTDDFGATWQSLATDNLWGYALCIKQDPVDENLLFLGTEFGLWVSTDGGQGWLRWTHGLPTVSVMDLAIHPRDNDLVIATHGRGLYILDDISPLRGLNSQVMAKPLHLWDVPPAILHATRQTGSSRFPGDVEFRGQNPPYGAAITFSLAGGDLPFPTDERRRR